MDLKKRLEAEGAAVNPGLSARRLFHTTLFFRRKNSRSFHFSTRLSMSLRRNFTYSYHDGLRKEDPRRSESYQLPDRHHV